MTPDLSPGKWGSISGAERYLTMSPKKGVECNVGRMLHNRPHIANVVYGLRHLIKF